MFFFFFPSSPIKLFCFFVVCSRNFTYIISIYINTQGSQKVKKYIFFLSFFLLFSMSNPCISFRSQDAAWTFLTQGTQKNTSLFDDQRCRTGAADSDSKFFLDLESFLYFKNWILSYLRMANMSNISGSRYDSV